MLRPLAWCLGLGAAATALTVGTGGGAAPLAAALVGGIAAGAAGNFGHEVCKALDRRVIEKLLDGRLGIAENHVVSQTLRLAQLKALRTVLARFDAARAGDPDPRHRREADRFSEAMESFLVEQGKPANILAFAKGGELTPRDRDLRQAVLDSLPDAFDRGLAARRMAGDRMAVAESMRQIRQMVEIAVLAEFPLTLVDRTEELPAPFPVLFAGTSESDGWFDLFIRDAADRIKDAENSDGGAFAKIWNAEQTALIKAIVAANAAVLERVDDRTVSIDQKIDRLLALAERSGAHRRAAKVGIPEAAVRAIVERLGGKGISANDLVAWLDNWIESAARELSRRGNEGEAFDAAWREAERRFRAGQIDKASGAFMAELERESSREAERQQEHKERQICLLEGAIHWDALAFDELAVIAKLRLMASIENVAGGHALGEWLMAKAADYRELGDTRASNPDLIVAIVTYRAALEERTRDQAPLDWAETQDCLGRALWRLGERESESARLEEAVATYHAALKERTRDRVPLEWAMTQNNLGLALNSLGERERGTARLEEAVAAHRLALEELTRDRIPLEWAATQNNLGTALANLGVRESRTALLEEAVAAYRAALEEFTRDRVPLEWATTQNNLGTALQELGKLEKGTARLEEAVAAYRAALEEAPRRRSPLDWAATQNNLGNALASLGLRENGTDHLEQAVAAYQAALEERTRDRVPLDWATTQNNLGTALANLGVRENGTARLDQSTTAHRAALKERTRDRVPLKWATTQMNLGITLMNLGSRESGVASLEAAAEAYRTALQEQTRDLMPLAWAKTQYYLGLALSIQGSREVGTERLEEAVTAYRAALEEQTGESALLDWAETQTNLGHALAILSLRESGTTHLAEAMAAYNACLTVVPSIWSPSQVAEVFSRRDWAQAEIKRRSCE